MEDKILIRLIKALYRFLYLQPLFIHYFKNSNVEKNSFLLESTHGKKIDGHIFYIIKQLSQQSQSHKIFLVSQNINKDVLFIKNHGIKNVFVIKHMSVKYLKYLVTCEYLFNDTSFFSFFIKKSNQMYINFWHGTPLKTLGQDMENITDGANVQRNFYITDKIIVNNEFLAQTLIRSHRLDNIYTGKIVIAPSPRNSILLDSFIRAEIRSKLHASGKRIVLYMPTWRGTISNISNDQTRLMDDLATIDVSINDKTEFYVKLHPFNDSIDLKQFRNIRVLPDTFELYEFLTAVDVLITDYSSIMYDFALTNRQIILYTYDKEEYYTTRKVYDDISRYPMVEVSNISELIRAIYASPAPDYTQFLLEFAPLDSLVGPQIINDYLLYNQSNKKVIESTLSNNKENVVIMPGGLWDNGVTTAFLNTLDNIDLTKRNYIVLIGQKQLKKEYEFRVKNFPKEVIFYPFPEAILATLIERVVYYSHLKFEWFSSSVIDKIVKRVVERDFRRIFGDIKIDHLINFTGFGNIYSTLLRYAPVKNKVMYVHTDMFAEYKAKKNFNKNIIFKTYQSVDKIAIVHENLRYELENNVESIENKILPMNNFLGEKRVRKLADVDLGVTLKDVEIVYGNKDLFHKELNDKDIKIFINIGRFDYQKGHDLLIEAFEEIFTNRKDTRLVIVAPHGPLKDKTINQIKQSHANSGIFVLGRMDNPYPLLKKCDCFVLSSRYEGLGLVVYEALAVDTAVVTVDLPETIGYLQNNEAIIVDQSVAGLISGMSQYLNGYVTNSFDFEYPKRLSNREFENLFKNEQHKGS